MKTYLGLLVLAFLIGTTQIAHADHQVEGGLVTRLHSGAHQLDDLVRYSTLKYSVKRAVSQFQYEVSRFYQCVPQRSNSRDHQMIPDHCVSYFRYSKSSFAPVDRFLYDTNFDYPQIYRQYLTVKADLASFPF